MTTLAAGHVLDIANGPMSTGVIVDSSSTFIVQSGGATILLKRVASIAAAGFFS